jgi:hypothetical protein
MAQATTKSESEQPFATFLFFQGVMAAVYTRTRFEQLVSFTARWIKFLRCWLRGRIKPRFCDATLQFDRID